MKKKVMLFVFSLFLVIPIGVIISSSDIFPFLKSLAGVFLEGEHFEVREDEVVWITFSATGKYEIKLEADPNTFTLMNHKYYAHDHERVYYGFREINDADPNSFRIVNKFYAADSKQAYKTDSLIDGANGAFFEYLGGSFSKDDKNVFAGTSKMEICDFPSFRYIGGYLDEFALDDKCAYSGLFQIPVQDRKTFQLLGKGFSKDSKAAYWHNHLLEGADPKSFKVIKGKGIAKDKNGCWYGPQAKPCTK